LIGLSMASLCASSIATGSCRIPEYKLWIRLAISLAFFFVGVFHSKPNRDIMTPTYKKIEEVKDRNGNIQYITHIVDSKEFEPYEKTKEKYEKEKKKNDDSIVSLPDDDETDKNNIDDDTVEMSFDDENETTIKNKKNTIRIIYYNPKGTVKHLMINPQEKNSNDLNDIRNFIAKYYGADVNDLKVQVKYKGEARKTIVINSAVDFFETFMWCKISDNFTHVVPNNETTYFVFHKDEPSKYFSFGCCNLSIMVSDVIHGVLALLFFVGWPILNIVDCLYCPYNIQGCFALTGFNVSLLLCFVICQGILKVYRIYHNGIPEDAHILYYVVSFASFFFEMALVLCTVFAGTLMLLDCDCYVSFIDMFGLDMTDGRCWSEVCK